MSWLVRNRTLFFFAVLFFISGSTYFLVQIARGYRFDPSLGGLRPHGLLAIKSKPQGARVYINGALRDVTDATIALPPGKYQVNLEKDGFLGWSKLLTVNKELVTSVNPFLFSTAPSFEPITFTGIDSIVLSPDDSKLAYIASTSAGLSGLWLYDLSSSLFDISRSPKIIFENLAVLTDPNELTIEWSADSKWLIVQGKKKNQPFLFDPGKINSTEEVINRTNISELLLSRSNANQEASNKADLRLLAKPVAEVLTKNAASIDFSPDKTKVAYLATGSAYLQPAQTTKPTSTVVISEQENVRQLIAGRHYVYDIKEDTNFALPLFDSKDNQTTLPLKMFKWLPSSNHFYWTEILNNKLSLYVCEYDGSNQTAIFSDDPATQQVFSTDSMGKFIVTSTLPTNTVKLLNLYLFNATR